jgi:chromosome undetermined scaffold_21, whole genome shotgun sequence|nr:MAG TPA: hypothetical protein [Caudoviricetes sp.]
MRHRVLAPNDGNEGTGGGGAPDQSPKDDTKGGEEKKTPETVPYERFAEVNGQKKDLEAQLAAYKQKEAEENEKKKKDEEEKAKQNGEYQKLIDKKDQELADYKTKQEAWTKREEALTAKNNSRIATLKEKLGEDFATAESLITGKTDPFELDKALDDLEKLVGKTNTTPKGGGGVPDGNSQGKLAEFKERLSKGERLST